MDLPKHFSLVFFAQLTKNSEEIEIIERILLG
jgi:hypothetical protein